MFKPIDPSNPMASTPTDFTCLSSVNHLATSPENAKQNEMMLSAKHLELYLQFRAVQKLKSVIEKGPIKS